MIYPEQVWLAVAPIDMRWGMDRLSAYVQHVIGRTPCDGTVYVFSNRERSRLKLLAWDGNGVWLAQRRLHRGRFVWPKPGDTLCTLNAEAWQWLISGVDWQRLATVAPSRRQV